jgi:hypothetical protein
MYKQLKKLVETKNKQNMESITVIQSQVDSVKEDSNIANQLAHRMALLQQEQRNKWTCQDKLMLLWILICFLATLLASLVISSVIVTFILFIQTPKETPACTLMIPKEGRLKNEENINLIQIIQHSINAV